MSTAGQNTVTGISLQADISLLYLLEHYQRDDFSEILLESKDWEDFTLRFKDRTESFEVKWHKDPLSYADVKAIIKKEVEKQSGDDYQFKIVAKHFSPLFLKDVEYVKRILPYIGAIGRISNGQEDKIVKKLRTKNWTTEEIAFLNRTEFISMNSEEQVNDAISESLSSKWYLYLATDDLQSLIATCFRDILKNAQVGSSISKIQFEETLSKFESARASASESFDPILSFGDRKENLNDFLKSEQDFQNLNKTKYLTPLTALTNQHLMYYLAGVLEKNIFPVSSIEFFIEKVLAKQSHIHTCFRILDTKWKARLLEPEFFLKFIANHFDRLKFDYFIHDALNTTLEILKTDSKHGPAILSFLKKRIFQNISEKSIGARRDVDYSYKLSALPEIIELLGKTLDSDSFIDLLFQYFDFTGDQHQLVVETPAKIYGFVKDYIKKEPNKNIPIVLKKLKLQFDNAFRIPFKGYEMTGGSSGFMGSVFSLTDTGLVRFLFRPLFHEIYDDNKCDFFNIAKNLIFNEKSECSTKSPIFLKRAVVPGLFKTLADPNESAARKNQCTKWLKTIVSCRKGFPQTSEVVFYYLTGADLNVFEHAFVMDLIRIDHVKFEQDRIPSNIFALHALLILTDCGDIAASDYLLGLVARSDFKKYWLAKEFLNLLGNPSVLQNNPDFRFKVIQSFGVKGYVLASGDPDWLSSSFLSKLVNESWNTHPNEVEGMLQELLSESIPSKAILDFVGNALYEPFKRHPARLHTLFQADLKSAKYFHQRFSKSDVFRQNFSKLADSLVDIGQIDDAKDIINILVEDPDPNTDENSAYNLHAKVKAGEDSLGIAGCRANAAWSIQKLVGNNSTDVLDYCFQMTNKLADLDGSLAKKFGYSEIDLYILSQSLIPLIEIVKPFRRNVLEQFRAGYSDELKRFAFSILRFLKKHYDQKTAKPDAVAEYLVMVFDNLRELTNKEAEEVLDFFELSNPEKSSGLFIYFAHYRNKNFPKNLIDEKPFKERLERLCSTRGELRQRIAWQIWRGIDSKSMPENEKDELLKYIPHFLTDYDPEVFSLVSHVFESCLKHKGRYSVALADLKKAMGIEIEELQKTKGHPRIFLRKSAKIVLENSMKDFLDLLEIILNVSDAKTGQGVYGTNLYSMIEQFKLIEEVPAPLKSQHSKANERLEEFGAFL